MLEIQSTTLRFEQIVKKLLAANNFNIGSMPKDEGFDFSAKHENDSWAIEVKYYRTTRAQISLLKSAAARLSNSIADKGNFNGMLVVSCSLNPEHRTVLEKEFGLILVDRADLFLWALKFPQLFEELSILLEEQQLPRELPQKGRNINDSLKASLKPIRSDSAGVSKGSSLCNKLSSLESGKLTWSEYEKLCDEILQYLFPNDLQGWHKQEYTDDGLNRFDYICRIQPTTKFWTFLIDHLNSRYIVFEFKNYNNKITQR